MIFNVMYIITIHSASAFEISYSDLPASLALWINAFVKSSAANYSSPGYISTPNLPAKSYNYFYFLILDMLDSEPCKFANAPKFGISAVS